MALIDDLKQRAGVKKMPCIYRAGYPLSLSVKQVDILLSTRTDKDIRFYALPTPDLISISRAGRNNIVKDLAKKYRKNISNGLPILIDQIMFIRLAVNKLDKRNKFILEKCDVHFRGYINAEFWV